MNAKNLIKQGVVGLCGAAALAMGLMLDIQPAAAHGERSQEPFLRMRTIQWYDMKWQPETTKVNDHGSHDRQIPPCRRLAAGCWQTWTRLLQRRQPKPGVCTA